MRRLAGVVLVFALGCPAVEEVQEPPVEEEAPVAEEEVAADENAIRTATEAFNEALAAADVEGMLAVYADDAILMPPNEAEVVGSEAIRSWMEGFIEGFSIERYEATVEEVVVAGQWAFSRASYVLVVAPRPEGEPIEEAGKYIVIWSRQPDGSWKVARDIWNTNAPRAATE